MIDTTDFVFRHVTETLNLLKFSSLKMSEGTDFQSVMPLKKKAMETSPDTYGTTNISELP